MPVVFVHGTSVREPALSSMLNSIEEGMQDAGINARPVPYVYGPSAASLRYGGACIPGFSVEEIARQKAAYEASPRLASMGDLLEGDPLLELSVLALQEAPNRFSNAAANLAARAAVLDAASPRLKAALSGWARFNQLKTDWVGEAVDSVIEAAKLADHTLAALDLIGSIARALAGFACRATRASGREPNWPEVEQQLTDLVHHQMGQPAALESLKEGLLQSLKWAGTGIIRGARGKIMPGFISFLGDILYYLANREEILSGLSALILKEMSDAPGEELSIMGHSLGGIIAYDVCAALPAVKVKRLVTAGSQVGLFAEADCLFERHPDDKRPAAAGQPVAAIAADGRRMIAPNIEQWLSVYDRNDFLSFMTEPVFADSRDAIVESGAFFPDSHGAYWTNPRFYELLKTWW